MTEAQIREVIRAAVVVIGGLRKAAGQWKVSPSYLSDCLNGRRSPGPAVLVPIGYARKVVTTYEKVQR